MDYAVGQPHHPGYLPMAFSNFLPSMTLMERVANTFMTAALHAARDFFVLPKVNQLLDKHFPQVETTNDFFKSICVRFKKCFIRLTTTYLTLIGLCKFGN
jgi:hypothetical protein